MKPAGIPLCPLFPSNTHLCFHYSTVSELLSVIVPFIKSGKETKEKCIWFTIKKGNDSTNQSDILTFLKNENNITPDDHFVFTLAGILQDELLTELKKIVMSIFQVQTENVRVIVYFKLPHNSIQEIIQIENVIHQINKDFKGLVLCVHNINKSHAYLIAKLATLHNHTLMFYDGELKITDSNCQKVSDTNSDHKMRMLDLKNEYQGNYFSISEKQLRMQFISATLSNRIIQIIMEEGNPDRVTTAIEEVLLFTGSGYGFFAYRYDNEKMVIFTNSVDKNINSGESKRFELSINAWKTLCKITEENHNPKNKKLLSTTVPDCAEIRNYFIVPMKFKKESIALFGIGNIKSDYTENDKELISTIAHCITPAVFAIKQKWIREEERKKTDKYQSESKSRLKLLSQTANELLRSRNATETIKTVCKDLMEYLSFDKFLFFQLSDESGKLYLSYSFGLPEKSCNDAKWIQLGVYGFEQVSKTGEIIVWESCKDTTFKHFRLFSDLNINLYITIPLVGYNEQVIGCIIFISNKSIEVNPHSHMLLSIISNQMSVVLEREKTECLLKENRQELNRAQAVSLTGSWSTKDDSIYWSDEMYRIFGISTGDVVKRRTGLSHIHPDDKDWVGELLRQKKNYYDFDHRIVVGKEIKWVNEKIEITYNESGNWTLAFGTVQDITKQRLNEIELQKYREHLEQLVEQRTEELRKSQEKLAHSEKMEALGLLAGGIAHDFNNMIQVITGITHYSLKKEPLNDPLKSNLELISTTAWNAAALTQRLLAFSKKQLLQPSVFQLDNLIVNLKPVVSHLLGDEIALICTIQKTDVSIEADQAGIEQVIMSIVVYAKNAMPQGGTLFLELQKVTLNESLQTIKDPVPDGEYVVISITDTSCGVSQDVIERIFEPFFTTGRFIDGTGLGLSSAYGTIQQSGGTIRVYSTIGVGTTFKIYLPVSLKKQVSTDKCITKQLNVYKCNETILFVEDSQYSLEFISGELKDLGYNVLTASNGEDALKIAKKCSRRIHLLITDVLLPGINGWELSNELLKKRQSIKTLFISGYDHEEIIKTGKIRTEDGFLSKPFSSEQLAAKIRDILDTNNCNLNEEDSIQVNTNEAKKRVLIVDDMPGVAQAFAVVLKNNNFEILTAEDGKNTLETASHFKPDVVVLDLNLPDMDGEQVAQELRKSSHSSGSFIIAASGYNIDEFEMNELFDACIVKPIDIRRLEALIIKAPSINQKRDSLIASQS
jgi:signal transduction histidine kinase/DNA-binding response OmpR family regulator